MNLRKNHPHRQIIHPDTLLGPQEPHPQHTHRKEIIVPTYNQQ